MTTSTSLRLALAGLFTLLATAPAPAQVRDTRPIRQQAPKPRVEKFLGEVLQMSRISITVRHRRNAALVRTFTYDQKLAPKVAELIERDRPFQYGDAVEIHYLAGTDTAVRIKGKRSPPRGGLR